MVSTYCDALMEKLTPMLAAASDRPLLVGLDGCCGSGKTTLAGQLAQRLPGCTVLHTDDYYLPLDRRTPDWMHTPAANMDLAGCGQKCWTLPGQGSPLQSGLTAPSGAVSAPGGAYPWGGGIGRGQLLPSSGPGGLLRPAHLFAMQPGGTGPAAAKPGKGRDTPCSSSAGSPWKKVILPGTASRNGLIGC